MSSTSAASIVALDLGKARVGVAIAPQQGGLAQPREPLDGRRPKALLRSLKRLATDENVTRFLVGLPLNMSGEAGISAQRAVRFCQKLADATGVEVELVDERLTSVQAERELAASGAGKAEIRKRVDGVAAAILLQQWLDANGLTSATDARDE